MATKWVGAYYVPARNRRGHKAIMLSDVCLSRTSGLSREQRGLGRLKIGIEVACDSDTNFKVKVTRPLYSLTTVLMHQAAAVVSVGTY